MRVLEMNFRVTETLQNGNERRVKRTVYAKAETPEGYNMVVLGDRQYNNAVAELKKNHYYNITLESTKYTDLMLVD